MSPHELAHDQQIHRMQRTRHGAARWLRQGARGAGRQHDDARCAELDRTRDRGVVGDAAVHQVPAVDGDARKDSRYCSAGEQGRREGPAAQAHFSPLEHIGSHDVTGYLSIFKPFALQLGFDQRAQPRRRDEMISLAENREQAVDGRHWKDARAVETAPDAFQALDALHGSVHSQSMRR